MPLLRGSAFCVVKGQKFQAETTAFIFPGRRWFGSGAVPFSSDCEKIAEVLRPAHAVPATLPPEGSVPSARNAAFRRQGCSLTHDRLRIGKSEVGEGATETERGQECPRSQAACAARNPKKTV